MGTCSDDDHLLKPSATDNGHLLHLMATDEI